MTGHIERDRLHSPNCVARHPQLNCASVSRRSSVWVWVQLDKTISHRVAAYKTVLSFPALPYALAFSYLVSQGLSRPSRPSIPVLYVFPIHIWSSPGPDYTWLAVPDPDIISQGGVSRFISGLPL
jgi:hypothetical protein